MIASLITALYLLGFVSTTNASSFLYICGALMIIGELAFTVMGVLAFNGLLAIFVGYSIQAGTNEIMGFPIDWSLLFGIAFIELAVIAVSVFVILKFRNKISSVGVETMVGEEAVVVEWSDLKGRVRVQGEVWKASSESPLELSEGDTVTVQAVEGLNIKISV